MVLIIDEAQNMPVQTLESLRILSNLETTEDKLLQIILVGQPELNKKDRKSTRLNSSHLGISYAVFCLKKKTKKKKQKKKKKKIPTPELTHTHNVCRSALHALNQSSRHQKTLEHELKRDHSDKH